MLRDFPLQLWHRQKEHVGSLIREFGVLVFGAEDGSSPAPQELLTLAAYVTGAHGPMVDHITEERHAALAMGRDRMDSCVPLIDELPELLDQVDAVLRRADDYCRDEQFRVLPRTPELIAFSDWMSGELRRQHAGGAPTPWPGPFAAA